jgi:hypothetical protein
MKELTNIADVARRITGVALSSLAERDSRADGQCREVFCTRESVIIKRCVQGIAMQIETAARQYMGIVLSIFEGRDGLPFFRISMPHNDPDLAIVLFEARDDRDVIAVWNAWSQYFALPKVFERQPGQLEFGDRRIGSTQLGVMPLWRRRGGALAKRKPKLLNRRRAAHAIVNADRQRPAMTAANEA